MAASFSRTTAPTRRKRSSNARSTCSRHDAKGQDLLGVVYFRLGLYPRAIAIYEQLRRTSPRDPSLLLNLALCYLKTGQPALARRDLEILLAINPQHARAWGYLGLACERLGALPEAEHAFEQGGHRPMARRMAERRHSQLPAAPPAAPSSPSREVRDVVAAAFEELDAGELSFELAKPASDSRAEAPNSWRPVELGNMASSPSERPERHDPYGRREGSSSPRGLADDANGVTSIPQIGSPPSAKHRHTLMLGAVAIDALENEELAALSRMPNSNPPAFVLDEAGTPSLRRPVIAVPPSRSDVAITPPKRTLPPPAHPQSSMPPPAPTPQVLPEPEPSVPEAPAAVASPASLASLASASPTRAQSVPSMPAAKLTRDSIVSFPPPATSSSTLGTRLVRTVPTTGFAARLESLRASSNALTMKVLERIVKGKATGESFGGAFSPIALATGDGQLVLGPRPGRRLSSFSLGTAGAALTAPGDDAMCFVREEVLLGFDGSLVYENGKLAAGEGELVSVVQLRGKGAVVLESLGEFLTLQVRENAGISVRREVVLGWFGRLVPRALAATEAPCGQRGLIAFAGEGRVLVASA